MWSAANFKNYEFLDALIQNKQHNDMVIDLHTFIICSISLSEAPEEYSFLEADLK